ncbi:MAG TPA: protein kinase [Planctomycetota bacterium]|nr:protein kinase [Planctomycetota bacterium]
MARLAVGSMLSSYEILAPLGAGTMGEVWRARDTRLQREVAIKVLPEHFAADEERLRRFEREAKTLASLNHPGVAQIFGVDQVGDTCFLVLELVPGESLDERLKRGPLPLDEALDVGRQIAEGLEAAHEAGVIHRDLKPANVRMTPEGKVKLLDFGLAKPAGTGEPRSSDSVLSTEAGRLLGTPTYMAPEQARGTPIDRRVDVWAFGCVLHECLTGRRAFAGETLSDVLGAVLHTEPDLTRLPAGTPQRVHALLADCLVKDPRARLRDMGEVRRQLELARSEPAGAAKTVRTSTSKAVAIVVVAAVASAVAAAFATRLASDEPQRAQRPSPTRFTVTLPDVVEKPGDGIMGLAVSPDGRSVAITSSTRHAGIYLRDLGDVEPRLLPGTDAATDLCFSPDGRSIAFFNGDVRALWRVTLDGGKPQLIRPQLGFAGMSWGPDGRLAVADDELYAVDPDDGSSSRLTTLDRAGGDYNQASPWFLPGEHALLFTVWMGAEGTQGRIDVVDLDSHEQRTVQRDATNPGYVPFSEREGALLYVRSESLWARRFDPRTKQCRGGEVLIAEGLRVGANIGEATLAVSLAGTLVYQPKVEGSGQSQLWWVSRDGLEELATPEKLDYQTPSLSADGKLLAFGRSNTVPRIYTADLRLPLAERTPRRLTVEAGVSGGPVFSPDGARLSYVSGTSGALHVVVRDLAGGEEQRLTPEGEAMPRSWSRDGLWIALMGPGPSGAEVQVVAADGSSPARPLVQVKGNAYDPQFSPDGRWVAYVSDEDGHPEVFVVAFPGGNRRVQVTNGGGACPRWSLDGSELYFRRDDEFCAVPVAQQADLAFGAPHLMFKGEYDTSFFSVGFLPTPDGRFLMNKPLLPDDRALRVVVVENFVEEVRAKLDEIATR